MRIDISVIPHTAQRYATVGDWWFDKGQDTLYITVSSMQNKNYENLVAFHELTEALLCMQRGIKEEDVTEFDIKFESNRKRSDKSEPGDAALAPYRKEHFFATTVERLLAAELDVDWSKYDKAVSNL